MKNMSVFKQSVVASLLIFATAVTLPAKAQDLRATANRIRQHYLDLGYTQDWVTLDLARNHAGMVISRGRGNFTKEQVIEFFKSSDSEDLSYNFALLELGPSRTSSEAAAPRMAEIKKLQGTVTDPKTLDALGEYYIDLLDIRMFDGHNYGNSRIQDVRSYYETLLDLVEAKVIGEEESKRMRALSLNPDRPRLLSIEELVHKKYELKDRLQRKTQILESFSLVREARARSELSFLKSQFNVDSLESLDLEASMIKMVASLPPKFRKAMDSGIPNLFQRTCNAILGALTK